MIKTMEEKPESQFLILLGKGDHKSFERLFTIYYPKVKRFILGFVKDEAVAADLTQDIFCKVWLRRETVARAASFGSYLFRMARNRIVDHFEQFVPHEDYTALELRDACPVDELSETESELYAGELSLLIDITVDNMPPQRKRVFIMSRKERLSNDEIAAQLLISKRTVENHLTQALAELRQMIRNLMALF